MKPRKPVSRSLSICDNICPEEMATEKQRHMKVFLSLVPSWRSSSRGEQLNTQSQETLRALLRSESRSQKTSNKCSHSSENRAEYRL